MGNERNGEEAGQIALIEQKHKSIQTERDQNVDQEVEITVSKSAIEEVWSIWNFTVNYTVLK